MSLNLKQTKKIFGNNWNLLSCCLSPPLGPCYIKAYRWNTDIILDSNYQDIIGMTHLICVLPGSGGISRWWGKNRMQSLAEADISLLSLGSQSGFPYQTWCRVIAQLSEDDCNSWRIRLAGVDVKRCAVPIGLACIADKDARQSTCATSAGLSDILLEQLRKNCSCLC